MHEAKTNLSQLVKAVEAGGTVTITRNGRPVAHLIRAEPAASRGFAAMAGTGTVTSLDWHEVVAGDGAISAVFEQGS